MSVPVTQDPESTLPLICAYGPVNCVTATTLPPWILPAEVMLPTVRFAVTFASPVTVMFVVNVGASMLAFHPIAVFA